jgi:hypothetical protein
MHPMLRRPLAGLLALDLLGAACSSPPSPATTGSTTTTTSSAGSTTTTVPRQTGAGAGEWTTYGGNSSRTAVQPDSPSLRHLRHLWTSPTLDGAVYGQPLVWDGRVFVATENDTVYALDAATGAVQWSRHVASPEPAGNLPCGDIQPTVGITATMVLDPSHRLLFASAETTGAGHLLDALDAANGAVRWSRDLGSAGPAGPTQLQRAALALDAGRVLAGFGGNYGDCGSYHGWVVGVPESGSGPTLAYRVPTQNEGAVWAPAGLSVDPAGDVYLATGNGSATTGAFDHGNAVVELSPQLHEVGYFAPADWAQDNASDGDLGSTAPILLPGGELFSVGKERVGYLLRQGHLGGIGGAKAQTEVCFAMGGDAWLAPYLYVGCPQAGVTAVHVGPGAALSVAWSTASGAGGPPTIAGGLVWSIDAGAGTLDGLDPRTGAAVVKVPTIPTEHFAAPAAGEGLLVVGGAGAVAAYAGPGGYAG